MKKRIAFLFAGLISTIAYAQQDDKQQNIDWQEDSTEIISINDIINEQQTVTTRKMRESHYKSVWSRRTYTNVGYASNVLTPKDEIPTGTGVAGEKVDEMKSKWGLSLQSGRSYRLHLVPIANTVQFNIDYTWIDLTLTHYADAEGGYDSSQKHGEDNDQYFMPWNLKKYEASYGMSVGPSVSICPFNYVNVPLLHYMQLHFYYHVGYHAAGILMSNNEDVDVNQATTGTAAKDHKQMKDNVKAEWGHGIMNSIGFSLSWKGIGLGYEHRSASVKYKPLSPSDFGSDSHKIESSLNRVFVQFRM